MALIFLLIFDNVMCGIATYNGQWDQLVALIILNLIYVPIILSLDSERKD